MTWSPPSSVCVRKAWLVLGTRTVQFENPAGGWFCTSLDLGYPEVRDSPMYVRPDRDGVTDNTSLMGARTVTAQITALAGAGARVDAVAAQFAPFMVPSARPELHYVLDRPGNPERMIRLRAAGYAWAVEGDNQRDIQLQWVAGDPACVDPVQHSATAWSGASTSPGRLYPLTFNRIYPPGGGSATTGQVYSGGDLPYSPLLRIYGPITQPQAGVGYGSVQTPIVVPFLQSFVLAAGHYVEIDTAARTAWLDGDRTRSALASIYWTNSQWGPVPTLQTLPLTLTGSSTSGVTQVQAFWNDRYLS